MARSIQVLLTLAVLLIPGPGHRDADAQHLSDNAGNRSDSQTESLGGGFFNHGVVTPLSIHRGVVATVDGDGRNVVLSWLHDHRGCYELLMIDAETGKTREFPVPFAAGDSPFASVLSSRNRFYSHFDSHFVEFDPAKPGFTFQGRTVQRVAMSMTEGDDGTIWAATYPDSAVASYNPQTGEFRDYGSLYDQNWRQYPRSVAVDDQGWVYFGIGSTASQIIVLDPKTGKATPVLPESEREKGYANVYRDMGGKVYGIPGPNAGDNWYEFRGGKWSKIGRHDRQDPKPLIAGSQGLNHQQFPDGKRVERCDLDNRVLVVQDPMAGTKKEVHFDYTSEGGYVMAVATAPNNTICGGATRWFFNYDPKKDEWFRRPALGQWNTVTRQGDRFYVGAYTHGVLEEWDPSKPWVLTERDKEGCNPRILFECHTTINRPHELLAHPDGKTLIMAGTPGYGYTGGGLLFWDCGTETPTLLTHTDLLPEHSTMSLAPLPDGKLLGGSTTSAGTGGEQKAKEAELYILDMKTKNVEWRAVVFPGVQGYTDMCAGPKGLVYGFADGRTFFVFDAAKRAVVHQKDTLALIGPVVSHQGPRVFVQSPESDTYVLFAKGVAKIDPNTFAITMLAESPVRIGVGGDYLDGRIFFATGPRIYSYQLPSVRASSAVAARAHVLCAVQHSTGAFGQADNLPDAKR